jgi:hypothetical protein
MAQSDSNQKLAADGRTGTNSADALRRFSTVCLLMLAVACFAVAAISSPRGIALYYGKGKLVAKTSKMEIYPEKGVLQPAAVKCEFFNSGGEPVTIRRASSSCGCIVVSPMSGTVVMPREAFVIDVKATPSDIPISKVANIAISTDSAITPLVTMSLNIHGRQPDLPYMYRCPITVYLVFNNATGRLEAEVRIQTEELADRKEWLQGLRGNVEGLDVSLLSSIIVKTHGRGVVRREYRWLLSAPEKMALDLRRGLIQVFTGTGRSRNLASIEYQCVQQRELRLVPNHVLLVTSRDSLEMISRKVMLRSNEGHRFDLTSFTSDSLWLNAEPVEQEENSTEKIIRVSIDPRKFPPELPSILIGNLVVGTSHDVCPIVNVPVEISFVTQTSQASQREN